MSLDKPKEAFTRGFLKTKMPPWTSLSTKAFEKSNGLRLLERQGDNSHFVRWIH